MAKSDFTIIDFFGIAAIFAFLVWRGLRKKANDEQLRTGDTSSASSVDSQIEDNQMEDSEFPSTVTLTPIDKLAALKDLPVWFAHEPESTDLTYFTNVFWEIEPTGEYLLYLADDAKKTDTGFLRYGATNTRLMALLVFETDYVGVSHHDGGLQQAQANQSVVEADDLRHMTVGQLVKQYAPEPTEHHWPVQIASLNEELPVGAYGYARLCLTKNNWQQKEFNGIKLIYEEFSTDHPNPEKRRLIEISVVSFELETTLSVLLDEFLRLVNRYKAIPYVELTGAPRF